MVLGSFLIVVAALKTPTRNGYNAQGVNLTFRVPLQARFFKRKEWIVLPDAPHECHLCAPVAFCTLLLQFISPAAAAASAVSGPVGARNVAGRVNPQGGARPREGGGSRGGDGTATGEGEEPREAKRARR